MQNERFFNFGLRVFILESEKFQHVRIFDSSSGVIASSCLETAALASIFALLRESAVRS